MPSLTGMFIAAETMLAAHCTYNVDRKYNADCCLCCRCPTDLTSLLDDCSYCPEEYSNYLVLLYEA